MAARVVVVGGGYGGVEVAAALDGIADVALVEPREMFVHHVAALRGLVDPDWTERIFLPYDALLDKGRVIRDRVVRATPTSVELAAGGRIDTDFLVLATGASYPFPAKIDVPDATRAVARIRSTHAALVAADRVLLLGAGPVGLELAGEIAAAWPAKSVTIVDPAPDVLGGRYVEELRSELRDQLRELKVRLLLGTRLAEQPPVEEAASAPFTVSTTDGDHVDADIWFRCYGTSPTTDYVAGDLMSARTVSGHLDVTAELRLVGQNTVFAIGDITAIPETKLAKAAGQHARVVAANIRAMIEGDHELTEYSPVPQGIALPLGPSGGASYTTETGVLGAEITAQIKGSHLRLANYEEMFKTRSSSSRIGMP